MVDEVVGKARLAKDAVGRDDAKAALLSSLDEKDKSVVGDYGDLLLFEDAASVTTDIGGSKHANVSCLLSFGSSIPIARSVVNDTTTMTAARTTLSF